MKPLLAAIFFMLMTSCSSHHEAETVSAIQVKDVAEDIRLPVNMLEEFEKEITEEFKSVSPVFIFMPLLVRFSETHEGRGVLKDPIMQFEFEKGGGKVDLKDVVSGTGSFYFNFPAEQFASTMELVHLYYVSQAATKKIQGETFGLGCGKWMDLKEQFKKLQKPDFLKVNTTQQRHLHVLAGHYIFIFKQTNQIYLAQLTIADSRFPNEQCLVATEEVKHEN
jgi:hypothetical protein